jgi:hypothetical protein
MEPSWNAFADYFAAAFPHLRVAIEDEALTWSPEPHYFLGAYLLPELLMAARTKKTTAVLHAAAVLEAVLTAKDQDLSEAALHSVLKPLADSVDCQWVFPQLGPAAATMIRRLRVTT